MFKLDLEKAEEPESNSYISWIKEKQESSRKTSTSAKAFDCVDHNSEKFLKGWEYQTIWPAFWEICMQVKKQQLELDME